MMVSNLDKYVALALEHKMLHAKLITPKNIVFDIRALLKCRWGCEDYARQDPRCHDRGTTYEQRLAMVQQYNNILLIHSNNANQLSKAVLEIERTAFLDGYYFAFGIRFCNLCKVCVVGQGDSCPTPDKVRPCDQSFGIDVYQTVRNLGLPCEVLQNKDDVQNRYGFVLLD